MQHKNTPETRKQDVQEHLLKLIIIGDCGVGKTNILVRFCNNDFKTNYVATIGVDFKIKTLNVEGKRLKFQIWDTAGQQRYRNIAHTYYKGAHGIILTYSITDSRTFDNIEKWMTQINQNASKDVIKMLVANKLDLNEERQVLAKKFDIPFMEVSAKQGTNVKDVFEKIGEILVKDYLPKMKKDMMNTRISGLSMSQSQKKRKDCAC